MYDLTYKPTGEVTRLTAQAFWRQYGGRYNGYAQDIWRGRNSDYEIRDVVVRVPDKAELRAATLSTPIAKAVEPLRAQAEKQAVAAAESMVARATEELITLGGSLKVIAPYPDSKLPRVKWVQAEAKYRFFRQITKRVAGGTYRLNDPEISEIDPAGVNRFVESVRRDAIAQYEAYVAKLNAKVGDHTVATLEHDGLWFRSTLTVTKADGTTENWFTQMILNRSVYGKVFNQFPTRKVK
jgi:hypothetical protein